MNRVIYICTDHNVKSMDQKRVYYRVTIPFPRRLDWLKLHTLSMIGLDN